MDVVRRVGGPPEGHRVGQAAPEVIVAVKHTHVRLVLGDRLLQLVRELCGGAYECGEAAEEGEG